MSGFPAQALADELGDILRAFDGDGDAAVSRLMDLYDRDVVFHDPLQTLRGRDAFLAMNRRILTRAQRVAFEVTEAVGGADSLFLAWTMTYVPHHGPTLVFEGATHARVRGRVIVEQRDYWDLLSSVAASLPLIRHVYARLTPYLG